jgi:hypothetical protein
LGLLAAAGMGAIFGAARLKKEGVLAIIVLGTGIAVQLILALGILRIMLVII